MAGPARKEDTVASQRVGSTLKGKWHLDALLGVGGMATVYAATHRNGQRAALKILHGDFARDHAITDRFLKESYVSNKIGHEACVRVLDDDLTEEGEPFLIMELLEGKTVGQLWKSHGRRMPLVQALEIAERICDCLSACHAVGVIHRDLKPANVFVTNEGQVKVLDFGVAQFHDAGSERTVAGTALGTPSYMSPEQAMGLSKDLDGRTDLFSVGAMLHAMVTGQRINQGRTEAEALVIASTTPVPSVARIAPDLPIDVIQLIDRSLAFDRRNRHADAREMQQAIADVLASFTAELAVQRPPARAEDSAPPSRRSGPAEGHSPSRAPSVSGSVEVQVPEDDPRVGCARDVTKHLERVLPNVRQFGWEHPATERVLRTAFDGVAETLGRAGQPVELSLRPYSMLAFGHTAWEPTAPWDAIPYNLFTCGMRALRILPGITFDELRALLETMMLDPGRDLPPEDDIVTAFWEKALPHVEYDVADAFAEGDAAAREAFYDESDRLEQAAADAQRAKISALEARAMAVATDRGKLSARSAAPAMELEDAIKAAYSAQLDLPLEEWSERCVDAIVEGLVDAVQRREPELVLGSLRRSSADLLVAGRIDIVAGLLASLCDRVDRRGGSERAALKGALTSTLFGAEPLDIALRKLAEDPSRVDSFARVLQTLPAAELPRLLGALREPCPEPLAACILGFVARHLAGHEEEVGQVAVSATPEVRSRMLEMLLAAQTQGARAALARLAEVEDAALRVEVRILMAGGADQIRQELGNLFEQASAVVRVGALRTLVKHAVRAAWPVVKRQYDKPGFHDLGSDERRETLRALVALSPDHGEPVAVELLRKGGLFRSEAKETSRTLAAEVLGELSRSADVLAALDDVAQARWSASEGTRSAARAAAERIRASAEAPP